MSPIRHIFEHLNSPLTPYSSCRMCVCVRASTGPWLDRASILINAGPYLQTLQRNNHQNPKKMSTCRSLFELQFSIFKKAYVNSLISNTMVLKWKKWGHLLDNIWKRFIKGCFATRLKLTSFSGDFGIKYYPIWVKKEDIMGPEFINWIS